MTIERTGEKTSRRPELPPHVAVTILPFNASRAMRALESDRPADWD